tara:strand:+ start:310 stop:504 length:195 start_codon:yes stop_codon:yes gene_type:complete
MPSKPGYKTTEFYLALAAVALGAFVASGVLPIEGATGQIVGLVESALVALGYTGARLTLKREAS